MALKDKLAQMIPMRQAGMTQEQIAAVVCYSPDAVGQVLRTAGYRRGPKERRTHTDEFVAEARAIWDQGLTKNQVAARLGVKPNAISGICHRHDFTPRPSPIKKRRAV